MLQMNLVIHVNHIYNASNTITGLVMACAAIGIAIGTWTAGQLSGKKVKKGLILIGIGSMTLLLLIMTLIPLNLTVFTLLVFAVAFSGGLFQIPCLSMLQNANLGRKLGDMIAYLNLVTFIFVLLGTLIFSLTTQLTFENSYAVFGVMTVICLTVCFFFLKSSPEYLKQTKFMLKFML
jgi:acyl-[acyl-carrier-protein]-phospholipid O-acyltransferase/long-chain-fatty-acid--[acyl-carrier-protein] ligase